MFRLAILIAASLALSLHAQAADVTVGQLKISTPWARATPKGASVGGGYMTITNMGTESDRLVGGSTDVAKDLQIHEMSMDNGVMKMRPVSGGLEIKPGQTITLKPGGYHIMFTGLKVALKQGEHFKATLTFARSGKADVDFGVEGLAAMQAGAKKAMPDGDHSGMHMKH